MSDSVPGVLGVFSHMDTLIDAIHGFRKSGREHLKVFSPAPFHDIEHALEEGVSPVRRFTLAGGLIGASFGYLFPSFTALDWILPTSGKPVVSLVAFTVIAFELAILFGAIFTFFGIALNAGLFRKRKTLYDERFTDDKFGIFIECSELEYDQVSKALTEFGAEEVTRA